MRRPIRQSGTPNMLAEALRACGFAFALVGLFSFVMNALMLVVPLYMLSVYDRVLGTGRIETLIMLTAMAAAALLILGVLDMLRSAVMVRLGRWLNARLAPVFLASSVRARLQGDEAGAQPLRDLGVLQNFIGGSGMTFLFDSPMVPLFVAIVWLLHPELGMLALGSAILLFALSLLNDRLTRKMVLEANVAQIRANLQAETTIRNAEVVRAMGMLPTMVDRWRSVNEHTLDAMQTASERSGVIIGLAKALRLIVQVAVLGWGALLVIKSELTPGSMIACSILIGRALAPVEQAMGAWKVFIATRIAYGRLKSRLLILPPEVERMRLPAPSGRLAVEGVTFVAPGSSRPVLRQVSFAVEPGEVLTVIGPSAAGKSTLCRLLVGLVQPTSGQVRLDGADLGHWDLDQLGQFVGYLPQDVELFPGTVGDNVARMGRASDEDVVDAAQLGHAHDMILRLPEGYDTQIGDAGTKLSGGQRQRIGLARAVYGNPRLIVLDEPNSNLDQVGEAALAGAVNELKRRGATMVIVGHRPSTLAHADKILVLKDGKVEICGPRDAVLQRLRKTAITGTVPDTAPQVGVPTKAVPVPSSGEAAPAQADLVDAPAAAVAELSVLKASRGPDANARPTGDGAVDKLMGPAQQAAVPQLGSDIERAPEASTGVGEPHPAAHRVDPPHRLVPRYHLPRSARAALFASAVCGVYVVPLVVPGSSTLFLVITEATGETAADPDGFAALRRNTPAPSIARPPMLVEEGRQESVIRSGSASEAGTDIGVMSMSEPRAVRSGTEIVTTSAMTTVAAVTAMHMPATEAAPELPVERAIAVEPKTEVHESAATSGSVIADRQTTSEGSEGKMLAAGSSQGDSPREARRANQKQEFPVRDYDQKQLEALIARGDDFLQTGDVAAARLFYMHAAEAGDGLAALAVGRTYDPSFLAKLAVRGYKGDAAAAAQWYSRAREKGIGETGGTLNGASREPVTAASSDGRSTAPSAARK
jgi:PrtD family type I secretion system ABC transporter